MKKKYIVPAIVHVACTTINMIAASTDGRYTDNSSAGGWNNTETGEAGSSSEFSHGQSQGGTGSRAKGFDAWDSWAE